MPFPTAHLTSNLIHSDTNSTHFNSTHLGQYLKSHSMDTSSRSISMHPHLATMPSFKSSAMSANLISDRVGVENMDGQAIIAGQAKYRARPWIGCILFEELTKDNLPPFYVRLQDDQVGHLAYWVATSRGSITRLKLGQVWPWDFDVQGKISSRRDNWGAEYSGLGQEKGKGLGGGKKVPTWTDPGLPLTYTSSHKVMARELDAVKKGVVLKRKAEEEAGRSVSMPVKKPRLNSMGAELKKMRDAADKKRQATNKEKERYAGERPELRDAMQVVDTLMRSATETEAQNAALQAMLLKEETQYVKNTDDMFDEWLAYNEIKRMEVVRMLEDHAAEIKTRDAKIEALEVEAKRFRTRLEGEEKKVRVRDARLTRVKSRWVQEQVLMERKFREIEQMALDLDELSELNYDSDEVNDGGGDIEGEPEEAKEEGGKDEGEEKQQQQQQKAKQEQKPQKAAEARQDPKKETAEAHQTNIPKKPETKAPADRELRTSIVRGANKSIYTGEVVNLDCEGQEDESDENPVSSQRKGRSRRSVRS